MNRLSMAYLKEWLRSKDRLPLVIRGARQVGKTWLVRHLAETENLALIELNLEERRHLATHFETNDVALILKSLGVTLGKEINPSSSILFIDEIQAAPELITKLRWFAEKMPELPVIAAGSLLEFALKRYALSMPVGRIEYLYLEQLSFEEFLLAQNKEHLLNVIKTFEWDQGVTKILHNELMRYVKEYVIIGGMPAAVKSWVSDNSLQAVSRIHSRLITTYQEDFPKYHSRLDTSIYEQVLFTVPKSLGKKFIYSDVSREIQTPPIKKALSLLCRARVCHKVRATRAHGIPLAAEIKERYDKIILLDVGLCSSILDLTLHEQFPLDNIDLINKGGIAEQLVGQLLRTTYPLHKNPALYYWLNTDKGASAEIDYVIQHHGQVVPIEVKAGAVGKLRSLHYFMANRKLPYAVTINSGMPGITEVNHKDSGGNHITYQLRTIPFYLVGQIHRLLP